MQRLFLALVLSISIFITPIASKANDKTYLKQLSKAFSNVAKKAIPAVVFIKMEYKENISNQRDPFNNELFRRFFRDRNFQNRQPKQAAGSGCIVSKDGYILTNNHNVEGATKITIVLNDGKEFEAKVIGTDPKTDLAVIKIEANNLPFLKFANSDDLEIGEWVVAIGSPFQLQASLTVGVVSAKGRQNLKMIDYEDFIQTDAAINPGNSGGPLLDLDSKIAGINTLITTQSGGYTGIGFAIPSTMAKHVMEAIIENGSVNRGHLGLYLQPIDKEMAEALDLKTTEGVLIAEVIKGSASEKAGLQQGDIIIAYNGKRIKNMTSFRNKIATLSPNSIVKLTIIREGKKKNYKVKLGAAPEAHLTSKKSQELGVEVSDIKDLDPNIVKKHQYQENLHGVMITSIKNNSIAARIGLRPGMLIQQINNKKINNLNDFNTAMETVHKKRHLLMLVRYQNVTKFVTIRLK